MSKIFLFADYILYNKISIFDTTKNNQMTILPYLGKEYVVLFELLINKIPLEVASVLHFSSDDKNSTEYRVRSPAVWVTPDKEISFSLAINGNWNKWSNIAGAVEGQWTRIEIAQTPTNEKVNNDISNAITTLFIDKHTNLAALGALTHRQQQCTDCSV